MRSFEVLVWKKVYTKDQELIQVIFQQCSNILFFHLKVFPIKMVLVSPAGCDRLSSHFTIAYLIKFNNTSIQSAVKNTPNSKYILYTRKDYRELTYFYWALFIMKRMLWPVSNLWSISVMPPWRGILANKQRIFFRQ